MSNEIDNTAVTHSGVEDVVLCNQKSLRCCSFYLATSRSPLTLDPNQTKNFCADLLVLGLGSPI